MPEEKEVLEAAWLIIGNCIKKKNIDIHSQLDCNCDFLNDGECLIGYYDDIDDRWCLPEEWQLKEE